MNVFDYFFKNTKDLKKDFVIGNKETISYKELYRNSIKIASYLNQEIGKDKNIVLIGQNSVFFITAYLGILKSGNVCVPLDFSIEQENLNFISNLTESKMIFCDGKTKKKLGLSDFASMVDDDGLQNIIEGQNIIDFERNFKNQNLAEIIFTSGSTGKPKGVMMSHNNIISNTDSIIDYLKLSSKDIITVVLPFYYCYGLSLLHTHLKVGGSIVLNNSFMFLGTVIEDIKKYKCTGFAGVPSHFQMLLKKSKTFKTTNFPDLRYVTQAGGKLHDVFIQEFVETFPKIDFFVMYGQTEATARLSYLSPNLVMEKLGSIGKSIPKVVLKVIGTNGIEVDRGIEGELIAKGENIMLGYYKDFTGTNNAIKNGWLYTGDIAKVDRDGFIYLVARKKEIIKVGGKRVSPKEIEQVVLSAPHVIDCTIEGVYDEVLGESIKATVVIEKGNDKDKLRGIILKKCKEKLSLFKIPQIIEFKYKIKLKSTGKK